MANRLAASLSPYLRQHADNPVDWYEWGEEAFAEARRRDVPIFLSVGYAACHWCHVMAHESFEDEQVAQALNAGFVPVKVDREERPDIDAVYMQATQALTGHGGWPMTCLLTTDGRPFFAGTYYPKPQLLALLEGAGQAWTTRRAEVEDTSGKVVEALDHLSSPPSSGPISDTDLEAAVSRLVREFDSARGGFGGAPKFPPSMVLEFLLRHHARTGSEPALEMAARTSEAMARGGIYDQLDGGFARYSVDADWVVPHFEKMLYDNAQLLRDYLHLWRITGEPLPLRVADETADFLVRRLGTAEGGFASALDADTDGVEGLTYAWTPDQLVEALGPDDGAWAADLLSVTERGTFEHGTSTLQLRSDPDDPQRWAQVRERLAAARDQRPQPARDDKVVTSWNGLAIAALAEAGVLLQRPDLLEAARRCAQFVVDQHLVDGRLRRVSLDGAVGAAQGVADDYGNLAEGLLVLHQATGERRWLDVALDLLATARALFTADDGGFHDTPSDGEALVSRPRAYGDNAEPSGQSALAHALVTASALTADDDLRSAAEQAVAASSAVAQRDPRFGGWLLATAEALTAGPLEVVVVTPPAAADEREPLARLAWLSPLPGLVRVSGTLGSDQSPLMVERPLLEGRPTAYVCEHHVCQAPTTDADTLAVSLGVQVARLD